MSQFVVVDIGCLECHASSAVIAVCATKEEAREALALFAVKLERTLDEDRDRFGYFEDGQHSVEILVVPES